MNIKWDGHPARPTISGTANKTGRMPVPQERVLKLQPNLIKMGILSVRKYREQKQETETGKMPVPQ